MFETADPNVRSQYELLNIIDGKATALMSFNALLLATISIWLGYVPANFLHLSLDIAFLALLVSCLFLLWIVWLKWSEPTEDIVPLQSLRIVRTKYFRKAWNISFFAVSLVFSVSVIHTVGTSLTAFGLCQSAMCKTFFSDDVFGNLDRVTKP